MKLGSLGRISLLMTINCYMHGCSMDGKMWNKREFHEPRNSENDGYKLLREGKCCLTVLPNSLSLGNELTLDVMMYIPGCLT